MAWNIEVQLCAGRAPYFDFSQEQILVIKSAYTYTITFPLHYYGDFVTLSIQFIIYLTKI